MGFEDKQLTSCTALTPGVLDGGHDHAPSGTARQVTLVVLQVGEALIGIKARERRHRAEQLWFSLAHYGRDSGEPQTSILYQSKRFPTEVTLVVLQGGEALIGIKARERRHRAEQLWFSLRVMPAIHFHVLFAIH
eukprot:s7091_g1.t1